MSDDSAKYKQIYDQCRVVVHLSRALADVHSDYAKLYAGEPTAGPKDIADSVGRRSAELMELLGNILNGMDAVDEDEDFWTYEIFEKAKGYWS